MERISMRIYEVNFDLDLRKLSKLIAIAACDIIRPTGGNEELPKREAGR